MNAFQALFCSESLPPHGFCYLWDPLLVWLQEEALRWNEELLRAVFDQAAVGFSMTDLDGRFLKVNEAYCRITGYTQEELLKTNFHLSGGSFHKPCLCAPSTRRGNQQHCVPETLH